MTETMEDRKARQDIQALRELSHRIRANASLSDLFSTYLLTLIGRFRLARAAVYVPAAGLSRYRLFLSKGHFLGRELPETVGIGKWETPWTATTPAITFLKDSPGLNPDNKFSELGLTFARILSWQSGHSLSSVQHVLVFMGSTREISFSSPDLQFIDLMSSQVTAVLSGPAGSVLDRLRDLERRSDMVKTAGFVKPDDSRTRERLLDSRNLQTLQDIAFRFKGGVSLPELFNTYLLTLMGRLRLKRAAIYVPTLPQSVFKLFLLKGKCMRSVLPETLAMSDIPADRLWVNLKEHAGMNQGNVFGRTGFSIAWVLHSGPGFRRPEARADNPAVAALIYMGADRDIHLTSSDLKFIEILNIQMQDILNLLDSFGPVDRQALLDWDKNAVLLMQENLMNRALSPEDGIRCRVLFRPSHKVGGDFYDFYRLAGGRIAVALADVVGHGIPAAMWTYAIRDSLRQIVESSPESGPLEPATVLESLNDLLVKNKKSEIPVSVCFAVFDTKNATVTYSSAGIDFPLLFRPAENRVLALPAGGLFLGCLPDIRFSQETVSFETGDILMIYTDGLQSVAGEEWRQKVLRQIRQAGSGTGIDAAERLLEELAGTPESVDDDKTALLLQLSGSSPTCLHRLCIPPDIRHLQTLRVFLGNVIQSCNSVSDAESFAVRFTTEDAVVNSIQHGFREPRTGGVTIDILRETHLLSITVADGGCGFRFDPARLPTFETKEEVYRPDGRGLYMMFQLMDEVQIDGGPGTGTTVRMVKYLTKGNPRGTRPEDGSGMADNKHAARL